MLFSQPDFCQIYFSSGRVEHSLKREAVSILQTSSTPSDTVSLHTKGPDGASNTAHCKQKPEACIKLHHRERISCPLSAFYQLTAGLAFYSKFSILSLPYCGFCKEFKPCRSFCVKACMFAGWWVTTRVRNKLEFRKINNLNKEAFSRAQGEHST